MYSTQDQRHRFTDGGLSTASGPKIIVMCYERLERDIAAAIEAFQTNDVQRSHDSLCHAQDLVHELRCMLDLDVWEHAAGLSSIYQYVGNLLVAANVKKSVPLAEEARQLLAELGDGFRQAALTYRADSVAETIDATQREFSAIA